MPLGIISSSSGMASACRTINNSAALLRWNKNGSFILSFTLIQEMEITGALLSYASNVCIPYALQYVHDFISQTDAVPISPANAYVLHRDHQQCVLSDHGPTSQPVGNHHLAPRRQRLALHGLQHW